MGCGSCSCVCVASARRFAICYYGLKSGCSMLDQILYLYDWWCVDPYSDGICTRLGLVWSDNWYA